MWAVAGIRRKGMPNGFAAGSGPHLGFPGSTVVKNPPAKAGDTEMWVQALCREHPLEEGMATRSSILAWEVPWTEEPGGMTVPGVAKSPTQLSN